MCCFSFAIFRFGLVLDFVLVVPLVARIRIFDESVESSVGRVFWVKKIEPEPEEELDARREPRDSRN